MAAAGLGLMAVSAALTGLSSVANPQPPEATRGLIPNATIIVTGRAKPDLFGTVALTAGSGRWADKFSKLSLGGVSDILAAFVAPARGLSRWDQLRFVQAATDRRIGWRSDGTQYGMRTYWANAQETLSSGFGDDNDRAVLKYQALKALGVPNDDMFLMVGRDAVRGGDYTLLAVRHAGRTFLLEDRGSEPVPIEHRTGFTPQLSFNAGQSWIHGRRVAATH